MVIPRALRISEELTLQLTARCKRNRNLNAANNSDNLSFSSSQVWLFGSDGDDYWEQYKKKKKTNKKKRKQLTNMRKSSVLARDCQRDEVEFGVVNCFLVDQKWIEETRTCKKCGKINSDLSVLSRTRRSGRLLWERVQILCHTWKHCQQPVYFSNRHVHKKAYFSSRLQTFFGSSNVFCGHLWTKTKEHT